MKKRIVCVLLTLIMLLSLVPVGASAASNKVSEAAITVLKQMTTFKNKCYHYSGSEFRTGYGTICEEKHHFNISGKPNDNVLNDDGTIANVHTITEKNADRALRNALQKYDEEVNEFASENGLVLRQNQHDALVVFSYDAGTEWMDGRGVLKSVIINNGSATELLNAMVKWSNEAGNGNATDRSRREVEVNMFVNGIYSNTTSAYGWVKYDPNGGAMPQENGVQVDPADPEQYTFYFDLSTMEHPVVPTRNGHKFLGWYQNGAWVPTLNGSLDGDTLTALWQKEPVTDYENNPKVNYQLNMNQLVNTKVYRTVGGTYSESRTEVFNEYLKAHSFRFWVDKDAIDRNGVRWSKLEALPDGTEGWVRVGASDGNDSFKDSYGTVIATATVTVNGYLNLRKEAGTDSTIVGALAKNDTVNIYEIKTVNGHQWGRSKGGWLCLTYTRVIMKDDVSVSDEGRLAYAFSGVSVGANILVHVEPGDNTNYVQYNVADINDPKDRDDMADLFIPSNTSVTVTNLAVYKNSETWAKVTWQNPEWDWKTEKVEDGKKYFNVTRSGWVKLVPSYSGGYIELSNVHYTVVADSVNVRDGWGDASNLVFTLNKGVQVQVRLVALIGENMWGEIKVKKGEHVSDETTGYVNLASKYFSRNDAPTIEEEDDGSLDGMVATVINTDSLRVRKTSNTFAQQIGRLSRGTTVAVWEYDDGWYKVDSNKNGVYDYKEDGWCSEVYLDVHKANVNNTVTDSAGNQYQTDGSGKGIIANTYSGVNVRTGPSTGNALAGKLLPGTVVEILETANGGKWGRVAQGWISMDYVTMISYNEVIPDTTPNGGTTVDSFDKADKTTTTAVYTGRMSATVEVYRNPTKSQDGAEVIRTAAAGENVTIYELAKVTEVVHSDDEVNGNVTTNTTVTTTSYWARINDGWVENPQDCLSLNALDEKVHTQTGVSKLNVRREPNENVDNVFDVLIQGDQVKVTALTIVQDKVWGRIDTNAGTGWIRLDYMSEGEVYVKAPVVQQQPTVNNQVILGQGSSTGGFVNNTSGYRYTGKVIRTNSLNVRSTPSDTASKTTTLKSGQALVIYEVNTVDGMAWGRCDAGWVYLYYVDLTPVTGGVDARVVANENTIIYSDMNCTSVAGTYAKQSVVDIFEIVGKMARTEQGWVNVDNLL